MALLPFYMLEESENYQEKKFIQSIESQLFPNNKKKDEQFFDLKEKSFDDILVAANTFSMFSLQRLIIVAQNKDLKEDQETALLAYIQNPAPSTVIIWKTKKLDKRKKFSKSLITMNIIKSFSPPKPQDMSMWIDQISNELGIKVDREAKAALVEFMGTNLHSLHQELEKLQLYIHPEKMVMRKHVDAMVLRSSGDNVFAFTDQVIERNLKKAYQTLAHLLTEGSVPLVLLSMLVRHYRILLKVHDGLQRRIPSSQLAGFVMIPPFLVQRYMDQAKKVNLSTCHKAIDILQSLDKEFKSTGLSNRFLLENAILKLASNS